MRFCPWYPLSAAAANAPPSPGVFQVRVAAGLLDYPRGKSAMIHYERADDLCAATAAFAASHPGVDWLCRHTIEMSPRDVEDVEALYAKVLGDFLARFGSAPRMPP
jgi:hypothetical protein